VANEGASAVRRRAKSYSPGPAPEPQPAGRAGNAVDPLGDASRRPPFERHSKPWRYHRLGLASRGPL